MRTWPFWIVVGLGAIAGATIVSVARADDSLPHHPENHKPNPHSQAAPPEKDSAGCYNYQQLTTYMAEVDGFARKGFGLVKGGAGVAELWARPDDGFAFIVTGQHPRVRGGTCTIVGVQGVSWQDEVVIEGTGS